ncbi:hypothetical protein V8E36_004036 [Tilletia maclaganii]
MAYSSPPPPCLPIQAVPLDQPSTGSGSPAWRAFTPSAGGPYPTSGRGWPVASIVAGFCGQRPNHFHQLSPLLPGRMAGDDRPPSYGIRGSTGSLPATHDPSSRPARSLPPMPWRQEIWIMGSESPWFVHEARSSAQPPYPRANEGRGHPGLGLAAQADARH